MKKKKKKLTSKCETVKNAIVETGSCLSPDPGTSAGDGHHNLRHISSPTLVYNCNLEVLFPNAFIMQLKNFKLWLWIGSEID